MMSNLSLVSMVVLFADLAIRGLLSIRVIMRRQPVGVAQAWLAVILVLPFFGAIVYLLFGELRLGRRRANRAVKIHEPYEVWLADLKHRATVDWTGLGPTCEPLARLAESTIGIPALPGNGFRMLETSHDVFQSIIDDVDRAKRTCHMVFYIWKVGGMADQVCEALVRAAARGVRCRVLVDDVGSRAFLRSALARQLRDSGVELCAALPAGMFRNLFVRFDLRMHRKIVVIDGEIAYVGSQNMVDPKFFKQDAGVGQWIDAMVRLEGPAVEPLAVIFLEDWALEHGDTIEDLRESGDAHPLESRGTTAIQVIPSGPTASPGAIERVLLMTIYAAQRELILTTPYFVPDESLIAAFLSAAQRGVDVTLVVPARVDSRLVRLASKAFQGDLVAAGMRVMQCDKGLLHTKSVTVDGKISLFGSLNLDPRSLHLNFEITLAVYDSEFTARVRDLQQSYISQSTPMDLAAWQSRPGTTRFAENAARLLGPLL